MENCKDKIHDLVIEKYSEIAKGESEGCWPFGKTTRCFDKPDYI